jgi:DNA-binding protein HU-beta
MPTNHWKFALPLQTIEAESAMPDMTWMRLAAAGRVSPLFRSQNQMISKTELIQRIADELEMTKKDVKSVLETLAMVGYKEMKKTGEFMLPGFAKFVVIKKPATKARKGINPFTKEPTIFKAKPARKVLKVRPVKAAKDAV